MKTIKTKFGTEINIDHDTEDATTMFPSEGHDLLLKKGLHEVYKFIAHNILKNEESRVNCTLGRFLTHFCSHSTNIEDALSCLINSYRLFYALDPSDSVITPIEVEGLLQEVRSGLLEIDDLEPLTSKDFLAIDENGAHVNEIFKLSEVELKSITNKFADVATTAIMEEGITTHSEFMERLLLSCDDLREVYLAALTYSILDKNEP